MSSREVSIEEARKRLGDYVNAALLTGTVTIITRNGRPAARIAPLEDTMTSTSTTRFTSEAAFVEALRELPTITDGQGYRIDPARAWAAYAADPEHWHAATQDNPTGDPFAGLALEDGPYWVTNAAADGVYEIHTAVRNNTTGAWETIQVESGTSAEFDRAEVSAQDIGGSPGLELRLRLIDPDLDGDAQVIATREIESR